ncbi:MAG: thiamine phosphate synthase, partial [Candidatus Sumerlaeota bacterium]
MTTSSKMNEFEPKWPAGLYLISDMAMMESGRFLPFLEEALREGLRIVQLRAKTMSTAAKIRIGREMRKMTQAAGAVFIVNDDVDLLLELDADGLHLGQDDMDPSEARLRMGPEKWIGWSTHNLDQVRAANALPIDYIGFGPIFSTQTKENPDPETGLEMLALAAGESNLAIVGGADTL